MEKRPSQAVPPLAVTPLATRLFLLCESCGVCRQHLLSIPTHTKADARSAAKCVACGTTTWLRVKTASQGCTDTLQRKVSASAQHRSKAARPLSAVRTHHPRTAALLAYARRAIEHRSRALEAREKGSISVDLEAIRAEAKLKREIQVATKRLEDYAPEFGAEHCPKCFVFDNANVVLFYQLDPIVRSKSVIVTCSSCGFIGSIPSM